MHGRYSSLSLAAEALERRELEWVGLVLREDDADDDADDAEAPEDECAAEEDSTPLGLELVPRDVVLECDDDDGPDEWPDEDCPLDDAVPRDVEL